MKIIRPALRMIEDSVKCQYSILSTTLTKPAQQGRSPHRHGEEGRPCGCPVEFSREENLEDSSSNSPTRPMGLTASPEAWEGEVPSMSLPHLTSASLAKTRCFPRLRTVERHIETFVPGAWFWSRRRPSLLRLLGYWSSASKPTF